MTTKDNGLGPSLPPYIHNVAERTDKISITVSHDSILVSILVRCMSCR